MTLAVKWVGSPNYSPGRDGHNPNWTPADPNTWIVDHTSVSTLASLIARFTSSAGQASSTYAIDVDGTIYQFVKETDAPWTNGDYADLPGDNLDSITIEHIDNKNYNGPYDPRQLEASAQLHADISKRRGIPLVHRGAGGGVLGHKECKGAQTSCPDGLPLDSIIARANAIAHPPAPVPVPIPVPVPVPAPTPPLVPVAATYELAHAIPIVTMATDVDSGKTVGPGQLITAFEQGGYAITQYSHDHNEGLGMRKTDIQWAVVPPAPVPAPVPVPAPTPPPVPSPPGTNSWFDVADREIVALIEWLKEHLAGRSTP